MAQQKRNLIEQKALWIGVIANLVMGFAGYYFYYLTSSEALLLDGNFSMIAALVIGVAVFISKIKHKRSETFPFGLYLYEALFVFFKGLLLLAVILIAVFQNGVKVIHFLGGQDVGQVAYGPILYYSIAMMAICFGVSIFFKKQHIATNKESAILLVESKSTMIDGVISAAVGLSFFLISWIPEQGSLAFFHSIGDALLVIILSVAFLKTPLVILKDAFIEIGGGALQNQNEKTQIISMIKENLGKEFTYKHSYINRAGSSYLAVIYLSALERSLNIQALKKTRANIESKLKTAYPFTDVEIIVS